MHEAARTREKSKKKSCFRCSIFIPLVSIFKDVSLGLREEVSTFRSIFYQSPRFCERSENDRDFSVLSAAVTQFPRAEKLRQIIHSNFMDRGEIKTDTSAYIAAWGTSSRTGEGSRVYCWKYAVVVSNRYRVVTTNPKDLSRKKIRSLSLVSPRVQY